jgi:hypothetical protein
MNCEIFFATNINFAHSRDAAEATGEEPEDTDFDMPKVYEPVSCLLYLISTCISTTLKSFFTQNITFSVYHLIGEQMENATFCCLILEITLSTL